MKEKLVKKLLEAGEKVSTYFGAISAADWELKIYTDGAEWTVRDMFIHLVESEKDMAWLINNIAQGEGGVALDFKLDEFNEQRVEEADQLDTSFLLDLFATRRAETVAMVSEFSEEQLNRRGQHPFLGESAVFEMLRLMYMHGKSHIRDLNRLLKEKAGG